MGFHRSIGLRAVQLNGFTRIIFGADPVLEADASERAIREDLGVGPRMGQDSVGGSVSVQCDRWLCHVRLGVQLFGFLELACFEVFVSKIS